MRARALACIRCGAEYPADDAFKGCERCRDEGVAVNLKVVYDEAEQLAALRALVRTDNPRSMWDYRSLLPVDDEHIVTLGEGGTPLLHLPRLGAKLGIPNLWVKDESRNPAGSFKDRLGAAAVSAAKQLGRKVVVGSSSGNAGAAVAALAARAGMPCVMFTTQKFPLAMKTGMGVYGSYLFAAPSVADRWSLMETGVDKYGWFPVTVYSWPFFGSNAYAIEGYKTIGYEIADQSEALPDHIVFPVGAGDAFSGAYRGLAEYAAAGIIERVPTMHAAEVFGPLERTLESGGDVVEPVDTQGRTSVAVSVGSNLSTYQALDVLRRTGGRARSASDEELLAMQRELAELEGLWVETSSVLSIAVLPKLIAHGAIDPDSRIVAVLTSHGLKDPETTAAALPEIPSVSADFADVERALEEIYDYTPVHYAPEVTE